MSWFDQVAQAGYQAKASLKTAGNHIPEWWNGLKDQYSSWKQEQQAQHEQLKQQREEASARISSLKDPNQFRNMNHEQRAAQIHEVAGEMPDRMAVAHAHPFVNALTTPFRIGWSTLRAVAGKTTAIAPHITPSSNTMFLFFAILYHVAIIFTFDPTLKSRIWLNVVMFFLVNFLVFDPSERNGDTYRNLLLFVIFFELLIPALSTLPMVYDLTFVRLYLANSFLIWTWVYYAVFVRGKNITTGPTKWVRVLIIIFWIGVVLSFVGTSVVDFNDVELNNAGTEQMYAAGLIWDKAAEGWGVLYDGVVGVFSNMQSIAEMRLKEATGEYYYGVVETNEKEKLGVYLDDLKASQAEYEVNEPVTVFATLTAKTLGDTINAKIDCYEGNEKNKIVGSVYPDTEFSVSTLQQEDLDCNFEKLPEGTDKITYTADFNFETIGYMKRYFADRDAITAATQQNIDLLDQYQIQDTNPVAHYTNGPVAIGMGPEQALIGVSESYAVKPRLALTLDGHAQGWGGKITALTEVVLLLPEQMSLDTSQCTDADWSNYTIDACVSSESSYDSKVAQDCDYDSSCIEEQCAEQLSGYNAYALFIDKPEYKDIKDYITISCRVNVDDVSGLLGATPISTKYFFVKTRYTYQISEDTSVKVAEATSGAAGTVSGETSTTKSETSTVPTFSAFDADEEMQYIFYHYGDLLFAAADKFNVPVCTLGGVIAETSAANPNYYQDGRKGLMGLPDTLSQQMSGAAGFTGSYNVYDPETNIKLGAAYLNSLGTIDVQTDAAQYYSGIYGSSATTENADLYAAHVASFTGKYCSDVRLENTRTSALKNTESSFAEGSISYASTSPLSLGISLGGNSLTLIPSQETVRDNSVFEKVTLSLGTTSLDDTSSYSSTTTWHSFSEYPLIQVFFDESLQQINYKYSQDFVINTSTLLEDESAAVIAGTLYLEYDGSNIIVSTLKDPSNTKDLEEVCSVPWYENIAYADCTSNGLSGLMLRNIRTHQNTLGQGDAKVQLEWNNQKQLEALS